MRHESMKGKSVNLEKKSEERSGDDERYISLGLLRCAMGALVFPYSGTS